ncbi:MAG TPA: HEAT repeat domain-containing protein, partial [bacterium]|nr:HEAT repeat domain-containing protein [bacterium]
LNKILVNKNEKIELRIAAALGLYELGFEKETEPILKKLREQIKSKQIKKAGEEKSIDQQKEKEVSAPQSSEQQKINEFIKIIRQIAANPKDAHSSEKLETIIKNKFLNNYIRSEAIIQLGKMKSVRSIDFLIERLKDKNEPLKEQVIWALAAIGNVKVYKELNNILMDNAERIEWRIAAALGLYELGFKKETEEILKNLREKLKEYRTLNKTELDNIFQSRAIEMIKKLAKSKDMNKIEKLQNIIANKHFNDNIRTQAIIELGNLKSFASVKILVNFLKNPTETLKEQIIWALGMIGGEIAIEQLKEILYDNQISIDLRISAALALYNAGEKNTAEPILKQLRGKYSKHREKKSKHKTEEIKIDELTENDIIPNINYEDKVMFILLGNINDDHIVRLKNSLILIAKKEPTKRIYVNLSDVTDIRLQHFKKIYEFLLHNPELKEKLVIVCAVEKIMNMIEESGFFKNIPVIEGIKND